MNFPQIQYILLFKTSCTYLQYASLKLENNCTKLHFSTQKCYIEWYDRLLPMCFACKHFCKDSSTVIPSI